MDERLLQRDRAQFYKARYEFLRDWILEGRPRSEIDPHGHIAVRTIEEWEKLLDAAILRRATDSAKVSKP